MTTASTGAGAFLNFNCVILDVVEVTIGDRTQIGPGVQILAADHPRDPTLRASGLEFGRPVRIGRNVWIHDHLPYSELQFFPKLADLQHWVARASKAPDLQFHPSEGLSDATGMENHGGVHSQAYSFFPCHFGKHPMPSPVSCDH